MREFPLQLYVISGFLISDAGFLLQSITGSRVESIFLYYFYVDNLTVFLALFPRGIVMSRLYGGTSSLEGCDSVTRLGDS